MKKCIRQKNRIIEEVKLKLPLQQLTKGVEE